MNTAIKVVLGIVLVPVLGLVGFVGITSFIHLLNRADEFGPMGRFYVCLPIGIIGVLLVFFCWPKDDKIEDGSGIEDWCRRQPRTETETNRQGRIKLKW